MTIVVWIAAIRGIRTMGYAITIEGIVIAALAITKIYDVKNPGSVYTKYIALVGVVIVACITGFEFDAYYVRFMAINIFLNVYKIAIIKKFSGEAAIDQIAATCGIFLLLLLVYFATNILTKFNHDTRHSLMQEQ